MKEEVAVLPHTSELDAIIRAAPHPIAVLTPSFKIVTVNTAYIEASNRAREQLVGRNILEILPTGPHDTLEDGQHRFRESLERVLGTGKADRMPIQRFDTRKDRQAEVSEERYWRAVNYPILDEAARVVGIVHHVDDVTELVLPRRASVKTETELPDKQATAILEIISDGFIAVDTDWRFTYVNQRAEFLLGREPGDLLGKVLWDEYPGLIGSEFERGYRKTAAERVSSSMSAYYPDHDRYYQVHSYPAARGISIYFRDVTAQMQVEADRQRLAAESEKARLIYEAALSNTPDLVYVFDLDHRFIYANAALLKMWGKSWSEAVGKNCLELGYEPWHAAMHDREIDEVVRSRQPIRGEVPFTGTGGRRIYDYIFVPVIASDGSVQAVAGTTRDVTDRKQSEEALRKSEQRFRATADHAPVLIWISDASKRYTWFNKPWLDFTGRLMEEELGLGWTWNIHPEDRANHLKTYETAFDRRQPFTLEFRLRRHDGVYRWILDTGTPLEGPDGEFAGYIGSCVDINDRIKAERSLTEVNRRKDEFLAMLAHELRNPLAAISNAVTVLKISNEPESLEFAREVIDRQSRQLGRLIDDLLDVSRINSGKIRLKKELCNAVTILKQAIRSVTPLIREHRHALESNFEQDSLPIFADAIRIEQVVVNLLTNAAKYTEDGGRIRLGAARGAGDVIITVEDSGMGIPADKLPEMFQLFSQGERSIARSEGGLGIGLTIVQKLTEMHGGRVTAASAGVGQGSKFTVYLPAADQSATKPSREPTATAAPRRGSRILVVDDNIDTAIGMARLLKLLGNEVSLAHDGLSAIEVARVSQPEFVLLDIGLPGMDGYQVARALRQESCCANALIIAVSGYGQDEDRRRSQDAGFDHHLVKPVDFDSLISLMFRAH